MLKIGLLKDIGTQNNNKIFVIYFQITVNLDYSM